MSAVTKVYLKDGTTQELVPEMECYVILPEDAPVSASANTQRIRKITEKLTGLYIPAVNEDGIPTGGTTTPALTGYTHDARFVVIPKDSISLVELVDVKL